jgi:hypothetical protein
MDVEVSRVGVVSAGKISAAFHILMAIVMMVIYAPLILLTLMLGSDAISAIGIVIGIFIAIIAIVLYTVMGFIAGAIGALIYNFVASHFGGMELKLTEN